MFDPLQLDTLSAEEERDGYSTLIMCACVCLCSNVSPPAIAHLVMFLAIQ